MLVKDKADSIHQALKEKLIEEIEKSSINDRLPSERKLVDKYKVCRTTVNRVMVELEKEGYIVRRVGKGTFVAPHDKKVIQDAATNPVTNGDVIFAYPDFFSCFIWQCVHHAELLALRKNINLINVKLQQESTLQSVVKMLENAKKPLGVILMVSGDSIPQKMMKWFDSFNIPIVFCGKLAPTRVYQNVYSVKNDHFKSGYLKMDHLLKNGHRKIGLVPNEPPSKVGTEHIKGIKQALYDNGLRWKDLVQPETLPVYWDDPLDVGYNQTVELLRKNDLTALLFDTIRGTFGGLRALYEMDLKCPDDVSIITAQALLGLEAKTTPALNTVVVNHEEIVQMTFDILTNPRKMKSKKYIADVKLVERESVKNLLQ